MKQKKLFKSLFEELTNSCSSVDSHNKLFTNYNEQSGLTSVLLAKLLEAFLKKEASDWDKQSWIDDSIITVIEKKEKYIVLEGVMIWGKLNTTEQWTSPFSATFIFSDSNQTFKNYTFLFCDKSILKISYEKFNSHRDFWNQLPKNWKYTFKGNVSN